MKLLLLILSFVLRMPDLTTLRDVDWQPEFTEAAELQLRQDTAAFFTHCSQKFDIANTTGVGVNRLASKCRNHGVPTIYLQDRYNASNAPWKYVYSDWSPTAFVKSDVGHLDIEQSQLTHAIVCGGFFEQCERSTVVDLMNHWRRDGYCHDFRITQVTDATFCVGQYMVSADPYYFTAREQLQQKYRTLHSLAPWTVEEQLHSMVFEELYPDFLQRQLPPLPSDINVVLDVFGIEYPWQVIDETYPTLVFAYRRSTDSLLKFRDPEIDFSKPIPASPLMPSQQTSPVLYTDSTSFETGAVISTGTVISSFPGSSGPVIYSSPYEAMPINSGIPVYSVPINSGGIPVYSSPGSTITYPSSSGTPIYNSPVIGTPIYTGPPR